MDSMLNEIASLWQAIWQAPHAKEAIALVWGLYLIWLSAWIVLQKREPAATLSWLLCLALLPILGFWIYYVFGPQRIARHRLRRAKRRAKVDWTAAAQTSGNPEYVELQRMVRAACGFVPSTLREVRLLRDGGQKYPLLLEDVAAAQNSVHLSYYIYRPDATGTALRDALVAAARRGVKVRLLLDGLGAIKASAPFFQPLVAAGGEVLRFHPLRTGRLWQFWRRPWLNLRTHRKIVVIDGSIGYVGGINITDEQDERIHPAAYRDLHLRIEGDGVRELQQVFVEDWLYAGGNQSLIAELVRQMPPSAPGSVIMQTISSGPDTHWETIHRAHVAAIHAAHRRIWLTTPYFVPGEAAMMALTSAALGGLDVRLLVPQRSDSLLVTLAARSYFDDLLAAGVRIYEYGPRMLHSKSLLIDDDLVLLGSANFDHRSFRLNFETQISVQDTDLARQLERHIEGELRQASRVRRTGDNKRPLRERLPEAIARLMSPLL